MSHPLDNMTLLHHVMNMEYDVIIVGGGLNGCTLALALAGTGMNIALVDAQSPQVMGRNDFDGRSYALAAASQKMLTALNLWDGLTANAQPMLDIKVTDGHAGQAPSPLMMHFDHRDLAQGPMGYMVEDRHIRQELLCAVESSSITHLTETSVIAQTVTNGAVQVELSSGQRLNAHLLVGADGRKSGTATRAGIQRTERAYDQTSLVCAIAHEHPHNGVAHQYFMPSGPLAILPLTGNRSSIVWTEATETAQAINALDDDDYLEILRPRFGDFLGEISLAGDRYTYPLGLALTYDLIADRIALVGD
ncbi:MAG: FAD-dependent oxidoreductase, partial [Planktomarina sp.]